MFVQLVIIIICFLTPLVMRFRKSNNPKVRAVFYKVHFVTIVLSLLLFGLDIYCSLKLYWLYANEIIYTIAFCTGMLSFGFNNFTSKLEYYFGLYIISIPLSFIIAFSPLKLYLMFWIILYITPTNTHQVNEEYLLKSPTPFLAAKGYFLNKRTAYFFNKRGQDLIRLGDCNFEDINAFQSQDTIILQFQNLDKNTYCDSIKKIPLQEQF